MNPLSSIRSIRHGCVCFAQDDVVIYADPYLCSDHPHDADLIIITHAHSDHYSPADIKKVMKKDTCFTSTAAVEKLLRNDFQINPDYFTPMGAGMPETAFECGALVRPLAAENKNHPPETGFGCLLTFSGFTYYISGDTDMLDNDVVCDVLFVCCDGIWNMPDFETRIPTQILAMRTMPGMVIPYHYGEDGVPAENGAKLCTALQNAGIPCQELFRK